MDNTPFIIERTFHAPVATVWLALTDAEQMKQWYFDIPGFKPEAGFTFQFYGQGKDCEQYLHLCQVTEVIPEQKLTHSWRYDGYDGISYVTFELFAEGNTTRLRLTHAGLETFPVTATNAFAKESFAEGWTYLVGTALKEYLER
jgi:uncharacterized protein YndB with AHSA1/START domain